ncbi:acyltransferase domain-containing protein [Streptomyces sp. NPDC020298]|uniref:acyltransferase domain-containing protein n=1 Tax=unclassified Streptomyces TaxID=2593676 RepID=UPI00340E0EE3
MTRVWMSWVGGERALRRGLLRRNGGSGPSALRGGPVVLDRDGDTAVLFAGGRAVRPAMVRALYGTFPVFRREFDAACRVADERLPLPLAAVVFAPEGGVDGRLLHRAEFGRAALFAYQVALYRVWRDWGVRVGAVAGDGTGALAMAYVAGALGRDEAVRRAVTGRGPRAHGGEHGERALHAVGFHRVLLCGPRRRDTATVGHVPALLADLSELQLSGAPFCWEQLRDLRGEMLLERG